MPTWAWVLTGFASAFFLLQALFGLAILAGILLSDRR